MKVDGLLLISGELIDKIFSLFLNKIYTFFKFRRRLTPAALGELPSDQRTPLCLDSIWMRCVSPKKQAASPMKPNIA